MISLSIVIPQSSHRASWEDTLVSVLTHRPPDTEVLVSCAGPYDDPYQLHGEVRFVTGDASAGELELTNIGCQYAQGEVLHVLRPGFVVSDDDWYRSAVRWIRAREAEMVAPVITSADGNAAGIVGVGWGRTGGKRLLSRTVSRGRQAGLLGPTCWAAFFARSEFVRCGGFDVSLGDPLADLDLALTLRRQGARVRVAQDSCIRGMVPSAPSGFRASRLRERVFWRHRASLFSAALHPAAIACEWAENLRHACAVRGLLGRAVGAVDACVQQRSRRQPLRSETPASPVPSRSANGSLLLSG